MSRNTVRPEVARMRTPSSRLSFLLSSATQAADAQRVNHTAEPAPFIVFKSPNPNGSRYRSLNSIQSARHGAVIPLKRARGRYSPAKPETFPKNCERKSAGACAMYRPQSPAPIRYGTHENAASANVRRGCSADRSVYRIVTTSAAANNTPQGCVKIAAAASELLVKSAARNDRRRICRNAAMADAPKAAAIMSIRPLAAAFRKLRSKPMARQAISAAEYLPESRNTMTNHDSNASTPKSTDRKG